MRDLTPFRDELVREITEELTLQFQVIGPTPNPDERVADALELAKFTGDIPSLEDIAVLRANSRPTKRGSTPSATLQAVIIGHLLHLRGLGWQRTTSIEEMRHMTSTGIVAEAINMARGAWKGPNERLPITYDAVIKIWDRNPRLRKSEYFGQ